MNVWKKKRWILSAVCLTIIMVIQPAAGQLATAYGGTLSSESKDDMDTGISRKDYDVHSPSDATPSIAQQKAVSKGQAGILLVGDGRTVAEALEELTEEEIQAADGQIILSLAGDTADMEDIFLPMDKGLRHVTLTSEDGEDYKLGSRPVSLFANGIPFLMERGTVCNLYGGGKNIKLKSTDITVTGGAFAGVPDPEEGLIVGGSLATEKGVDISISGSCNVLIEGVLDMKISNIYAGCFTDAGNVTAKINETNLMIRDSYITTCVITGGSYVWGAPTSDVTLDLDEANILVEDSQIDLGYMDFTFSMYGGHMGNDEVKNTKMHCGSTNITVCDSEITPSGWGGGEIFGGSYDTDKNGTDDVAVDHTRIDLKNSGVNGVFGGGYYVDQCTAKTGTVEILVDGCEINPSAAFDIPIILGGGIYTADEELGDIPALGSVNISLDGAVTAVEDSSQISVWGEGYVETGKTSGNQTPEESHLLLGETATVSRDIFDLDSRWTDVTLEFLGGRKKTIQNITDYEDLKEKMVEACLIGNANNGSTNVESQVKPSDVVPPELPEDTALSGQEIEEKTETAIREAEKALKKYAEKVTPEGLIEATGNIEFEDMDKVESLAVNLQMEFLDMELQAVQKEDVVEFVPSKLTLEISPYVTADYADGSEKTQKLMNDQLNGGQIKFTVGIPDSVTEKYADVVHYRGEGNDESYQVEIEAGKVCNNPCRGFQ